MTARDKFIASIAALKTDGDLDGDMSGDDAVVQLSSLIEQARVLEHRLVRADLSRSQALTGQADERAGLFHTCDQLTADKANVSVRNLSAKALSSVAYAREPGNDEGRQLLGQHQFDRTNVHHDLKLQPTERLDFECGQYLKGIAGGRRQAGCQDVVNGLHPQFHDCDGAVGGRNDGPLTFSPLSGCSCSLALFDQDRAYNRTDRSNSLYPSRRGLTEKAFRVGRDRATEKKPGDQQPGKEPGVLGDRSSYPLHLGHSDTLARTVSMGK